MRLVIHAPWIYLGGGRALLVALLEALKAQPSGFTDVLAVLDSRLELSPAQTAGIRLLASVEPTLWSRFRAERVLASATEQDDLVLCFANLPPLYRNRGFVITYLQNTYAVATERGVRLNWRQRLGVAFQRSWLRLTNRHSDLFAVQTATMRDLLVRHGGLEAERIVLAPFMGPAEPPRLATSGEGAERWDFGYVSLPWPHKNHRRLIEAFAMLAEEGITPSLVLTVPRAMDPALADWIEQTTRRLGLRVTNVGHLPQERIEALYGSIDTLIFPSLSESFALPLLEAQRRRVPILAPERDYVRDVVVPSETFDPESPRSIMRAVLRFIGKAEAPVAVPDAQRFLTELYRLGRRGTAGRSAAPGPDEHAVQAREYFDRTAAAFSARYAGAPDFQERLAVWQRAIERALRRVPSASLCLDMGCGDGALSRSVASRGIRTIGFDQSETMLALARERGLREGGAPQVEYVNATIPFTMELEARFRGAADVIICSSMLEYVPDYEAALRQFRAMLSPGGVLMLSLPNRSSVYRGLQRLCRRLPLPRDSYVRYQLHQFDADQTAVLLHRLEYGVLWEEFFGLPLQGYSARIFGRSRGPSAATMFLVAAEKLPDDQ